MFPNVSPCYLRSVTVENHEGAFRNIGEHSGTFGDIYVKRVIFMKRLDFVTSDELKFIWGPALTRNFKI